MAVNDMITVENLLATDKNDLPETAKALEKDDILKLVGWLAVKDDELRYKAFLLLQNRSAAFSDVYTYWEVLRGKLKSENSYQRSIGAMLIAENAKWDTENKMAETLDDYLELLKDEKPITVRQCIQSLGKIAAVKPELSEKITNALISVNLTEIKETMRKSVLLDILNVLAGNKKSDETEAYVANALTGELLDKKAKKQVEALFLV
jgi:hypothetical protein